MNAIDPEHYKKHPSGIECITVAQHMSFNLGNVLKYIWRADLKGDCLEDLNKAKKYLEFEIERRAKMKVDEEISIDAPHLRINSEPVVPQVNCLNCSFLRARPEGFFCIHPNKGLPVIEGPSKYSCGLFQYIPNGETQLNADT